MTRKLIIVCDDGLVYANGVARTFRSYPEFEILTCVNAGEVLDIVRERGVPDALIVERAVSYYTAYEELDGYKDLHVINTGFQLIRRLLEIEGMSDIIFSRMFVGLMHTDSFPTNEKDQVLISLLKVAGKLIELAKPFDTIRFEVDLCRAMGVECRLSQELISWKEDQRKG